MAKIFLVAVIKYAARSNLRKEGPVYFNIQFKIQSILVMCPDGKSCSLGSSASLVGVIPRTVHAHWSAVSVTLQCLCSAPELGGCVGSCSPLLS